MGTQTPHDPEVVAVAKKIRYDLTALQAKVSLLLEELAKLQFPDPEQKMCPRCGPIHRSVRLEEHLANVHGEKVDA